MLTAAELLPCTPEPIPVVSGLSSEEFNRRFRRPGRPVIIDGVASDWQAMERWTDHDLLIERVGAETEVWLRQVLDPASDYVEEYKERRFADFINDLELAGNTDYLTQGLIFPPKGLPRIIARKQFPALLETLQQDCRPPSLIDRAKLAEGVIWIGSGGQTTPLHFDEAENLNTLVAGTKDWLLFPPEEGKNLLVPGADGRGSVLSSLELLTANGTWSGGPVRTAYRASPQPGQTLYVPSGYCHQVKSGMDASIAVNFWYWDYQSVLQGWRSLRQLGLRRMGYDRPLKRAVFEALVLAGVSGRIARYPFDKRKPWPDPDVGAASYQR